MARVRLFGAATSSCSFRVRIALNVKGVAYESEFLTPEGRRSEQFGALNPQRLIPFLVNGDEKIAQSLTIIEYAEEVFSGPKLLPQDAVGRARARAIASYIASEIQPLQNTRIDAHMQTTGIDLLKFKQHWIREGFRHLEAMLSSPETGDYCHGNAVTVADCCLIPQVYNALNIYKVPVDDFPTVKRIYEVGMQLPAVKKAWPDDQPDFKPAN